jgi:hypothetical protein
MAERDVEDDRDVTDGDREVEADSSISTDDSPIVVSEQVCNRLVSL